MLEERRTKGNMNNVFKILEGFGKVGGDGAFLKLAHSTHTYRPEATFSNSASRGTRHMRKMFFSRVVNFWTNLLEEVLTMISVNDKKKLYPACIKMRRRGTPL